MFYLTPIEILALILIITGIVKLIIIFIAPEKWFAFARKIMMNPSASKWIYLALSLIVLWVLVSNGVSIVTILAVMLFCSLFIGIGMMKYAPELIKAIQPKNILKDMWLYVLIWLALCVWGLVEIFS